MSCRRWILTNALVLGLRLAIGAVVVALAIGCGSNSTPTDPGDPPVDTVAKIGVIGCSQTGSAWRGWLERGDPRVWNLVVGYGGGGVSDWAQGIPNGDYWRRFEDNMAANPPANIIWFHLCDRNTPPANIMEAEAVIGEIRRRYPAATIYVSPLAEFERPETCRKANFVNSRLMTDHLIMSGLALRGPLLPMVLVEWVEPPEGDGRCHVGPSGRAGFGEALAGFEWRVQ